MNDKTFLQARSIELAQRLYRQKQRATTSETKLKLDDAADELIKIDDSDRFYHAQSRIEADTYWTEEWRALAHELNLADQAIRHESPMSSEDAFEIIEEWAELYQRSQTESIRTFGHELETAVENLENRSSQHKSTLNYLLTVLETLLTDRKQSADPYEIEPTVRLVRCLRDAILVHRQLTIDIHELIREDAIEDHQMESLNKVRSSITGMFNQIGKANI